MLRHQLRVRAAVEALASQDVLDEAVEAFDRGVGLRAHRRGQAMLDAGLAAGAVEVVVSGGGALAQAERPVGEGPQGGVVPVNKHMNDAEPRAKGR